MILYKNLDLLRAISIIGIIFGHICLQLNYEPLGRFLGYLFVQIFFLLSAYLLGLKYENIPTCSSFLLNRWKKLSYTYYPFFLIAVFVIYVYNREISSKTIVTHLLYINYIIQDNSLGVAFGHLWYISMQMLCYVFVAIVCRKEFVLFVRGLRVKGLFAFCMGVLLVSIVGMAFNIPCRIFIVLASYLVIFSRATDVQKYIYKTRVCIKMKKDMLQFRFSVALMGLFVFVNVCCLILFLYYDLSNRLLLRDIFVLFTSIVWLVCFLFVGEQTKFDHFLPFVSSLSFELYLIHHPFILGQYSLLNKEILFENTYINCAFAIICVFILSFLLKKISAFVRICFD